MRKDITILIDDIKYTSDSLTDLDRLPIIQLNVILDKITTLTKKTTILLHYVEKQGEERKKIRQSSIKETPVEHVSPDAQVEISADKPENNKEKLDSVDIEGHLKRIIANNLTTAIGINEKYLFASELFDGKLESFTEAIKNLDSLDNFDQAEKLIGEFANQYKWDKESESVLIFTELVARRFNQP